MKNKLLAILFIIVLMLWIMALGLVLISNVNRPEAQALPEPSVRMATQEQIDAIEKRFAKPKPKKVEETTKASQITLPTSGLTMRGGLFYFNGRTESWYSSNVKRHYKTGQWHKDGEGFWHDADGYYVVASCDYPLGTILTGSKGQCKVLDECDKSGWLDYYVCW